MATPTTPWYPMTHDDAVEMNGNLQMIAAHAVREGLADADWKTIQALVRTGNADKYFDIGDQLITTWNNGETDLELPWDVVHFGDVVNDDGETVPGMYLQSHYALSAVQFDGNEAFYVPTEALPAGTYFFTMGNDWGDNVKANATYKFTTTKEIPAGGHLVLGNTTDNTSALPDKTPSTWRVRTYSNANDSSLLEILTLSEGSTGTDLGVLSSSTKYSTSGINNMQRSAYGYNRWSQSAMRQWLNSRNEAGGWWTPQNPFDHAPDQAATLPGFMAGLPSEFLDVIKPIKVVTALNTISDSEIGVSEETFDRFFCAALQQEFIDPQRSGEGETWDYWKKLLGTQQTQSSTRPEHIRYAIENHSSAVDVRLRSANRGAATRTWAVRSSGNAYLSSATVAGRPAPACVIC